MKYCNLLAGLLFSFCFWSSTSAQDVEQKITSLQRRLREDPLKVSGSFSAMGQFYNAIGIENRAIPFNGRVMAAMNFDLLGINTPFTLVYSNGGLVFNKRLPSYNFIGISPSYKWAKILLGTRTMDFGKYSFSKHSFSGAGVELTPGNWIFSSFYGRLRRARIPDLQGFNTIDPYFRRMGLGTKIGYENDREKAIISLFKAWDDPTSVPQSDSIFNFNPGENVILSGEIKKGLGRRIDLEATYSKSGFTAIRSQAENRQEIRLSNFVGLLHQNLSTRINDAFETKLTYKLPKLSFDLAYERIDPGYRTMGALFFNNDLENVSAGVKLRLLKGRLMVNSRSGLQRNNLNKDQANDYKRFVGSVNFNLLASKKLTFSGQVSNFNTANRRAAILDPNSPIIVTNLVVNNLQATTSINYVLANNNTRSSTMLLTANFVQGNTVVNDEIKEDQSSESANAFAMYSLELKPFKWTLGLNSAYTLNQVEDIQVASTNIGFFTGKKMLGDKVNIELQGNVAFNTQSINELVAASGRLYNLLVNLSLATSPTSALSFTSGFLSNHVINSATINTSNNFSEFRNTLHFQYRVQPSRK